MKTTINNPEPTNRLENEMMIYCGGQGAFLTYRPCKNGYWCQVEAKQSGQWTNGIFLGVLQNLEQVRAKALQLINLYETTDRDKEINDEIGLKNIPEL